MLKQGETGFEEVVPDSEDERLLRELKLPIHENTIFSDVIEISSDEEEVINGTRHNPHALPSVLDLSNVFEESSLDKPSLLQRLQTPSRRKKVARYTRVIESSSSDEDNNDNIRDHHEELEVIELSDSSIEVTIKPESSPHRRGVNAAIMPTSIDIETENHVGEMKQFNDGAILILDEPRSASRPLRLAQTAPAVSKAPLASSFSLLEDSAPTSDKNTSVILNAVSPVTPAKRRPPSHRSSVLLTPSSKTTKKPTTPLGSSKKAQAAADQASREVYAQKLFDDLNKAVFDDGLPKNTKLIWSKRLLSTAGRAKWHRSKDGVNTTEIELAEKILDCNDRIRNTLSHEMCHLASWLIDGDPKECHGKLWKKWITRVMQKRPDIQISTRHDYEISYPFQWKCQKCNKIYGRFSKSIRPDEVVCGACKEGNLLPLFTTARRDTFKAQKTSRMAAGTPQGSPCSVPRPKVQSSGEYETVIHDSERVIYTVESDSDIEILTTAMKSATINA